MDWEVSALRRMDDVRIEMLTRAKAIAEPEPVPEPVQERTMTPQLFGALFGGG